MSGLGGSQKLFGSLGHEVAEVTEEVRTGLPRSSTLLSDVGGDSSPEGVVPPTWRTVDQSSNPSPREALEDVTVTLRTDLWPGEKYQVKV